MSRNKLKQQKVLRDLNQSKSFLGTSEFSVLFDSFEANSLNVDSLNVNSFNAADIIKVDTQKTPLTLKMFSENYPRIACKSDFISPHSSQTEFIKAKHNSEAQ
jgi:inactivated superfamily I helicase